MEGVKIRGELQCGVVLCGRSGAATEQSQVGVVPAATEPLGVARRRMRCRAEDPLCCRQQQGEACWLGSRRGRLRHHGAGSCELWTVNFVRATAPPRPRAPNAAVSSLEAVGRFAGARIWRRLRGRQRHLRAQWPTSSRPAAPRCGAVCPVCHKSALARAARGCRQPQPPRRRSHGAATPRPVGTWPPHGAA